MAYRLLQLAAIGQLGEMKREVRSIREALVTVGLTRIRAWLPALLLRPAGPSVDSALPTVLSRARLAKLLAERLYPAQAGFAFAAGMLSGGERRTLAIARSLLGSEPVDLSEVMTGLDRQQTGRAVIDALTHAIGVPNTIRSGTHSRYAARSITPHRGIGGARELG